MTRAEKAKVLRALAATRVLVKDGPFGTAIQARGLTDADYQGTLSLARDQKGNNDLLNLTRPDVIRAIVRDYLDAGANIVATNTFNANAISQADYAAETLVGDINRAAARLLREAVDAYEAEHPGTHHFVVGALGPTNKTLSVSPDVNNPGYREVSFDHVKAVYAAQIEALLEGGVDFILVETIFDTLNAKAALVAVDEIAEARGEEIPVMVSMTLTDLSGRNLSGQTVEAFWHSVRHARPIAVGLNCSFGATELKPYVATLARQVDTLLQVYPNAGLPNDLGQYDELPAHTGGLVGDWAEHGMVNIVGGCCGTTPAHIAAIARAVAGKTPRAVPVAEPALRLSGLEPMSYAA